MVERVLDAALGRGGEFAEVFVEDRRGTSASLDDGRVEELSSGRDRGAGVRVVVGETTGYAHTADLSEPGLLAGGRGGRRRGPRRRAVPAPWLSPPTEAPRPYDVTIFPEEVDEGTQDRTAGARRRRRPIGRVGGDPGLRRLRRQPPADPGGQQRRGARRPTTRCARGSRCRAWPWVTPACRRGSRSAAFTVGFELFDTVDVEEVADAAARRALAKLSARPAPSGEVPIVLASGSGGILFHEACGHGLEADHIAKDASVYVGQVGSQVASPLVTLVDDGTIGREWGTFAVDDEGHPARRNVLIENGVLTDYMWDYLRARQEGRQSSGNGRRQSYRDLPMVRMTNTFLIDGDSDPDELLAQTPTGVYVAKLGEDRSTPRPGTSCSAPSRPI